MNEVKGMEKETKATVKAEVFEAADIEKASEKLFGKGVRPYTVRAAFKASKREKATLDEAKAIVKAFRERSVK